MSGTAWSLDGRSLSPRELAARAGAPLRVELSPLARERVAASHRAAVEAVATRPVYGRTTGVGANRSTELGPDERSAAEHALALLRSHATSAGSPRSAERVRAMLLVRLNQLAAGGSGISPAAVEALVAMVNADALPPVRELGGIGTGDLPALATTALGLLGEVPLGAPLPSATLGVHDALPFISSNAATLADAALATERLLGLAAAGLAVSAITAVAVRANLEAFDPVVEASLPGAGGAAVCRAVRQLVPHPGRDAPARIQDPFAVRCLPQVNGAVLDALAHLDDVVTAHLNVACENPMIRPGANGPEVVHHGGFHLGGLALACDGASLAVAASVPLLLGRLAMLLDPAVTGLAPFLGDGRPGASGLMLLEFVAGSALAVLRAAAAPSSLGTISISRGAEDDASFASRAAVQLFQAADAWAVTLGCELVAAVRAVRMRGIAVPSSGWGAAFAAAASLPADLADRDLTGDVEQAVALLPALAAAAEPATAAATATAAGP